jgi:hypothetical protein
MMTTMMTNTPPTTIPATLPTTTTPVASASVVLAAVMQMNEDDLKHLYRCVRDQLRIAHLLSADNLNVVSVRLSLDRCEQVKRLALARGDTLSEVVRTAIDEYCQENRR